MLRSGTSTLFASAPAAVIAWFVARSSTRPDAREIGRELPAVLASLAFAAVFLALAWLLKHTELEMLLRSLRRRRGA